MEAVSALPRQALAKMAEKDCANDQERLACSMSRAYCERDCCRGGDQRFLRYASLKARLHRTRHRHGDLERKNSPQLTANRLTDDTRLPLDWTAQRELLCL